MLIHLRQEDPAISVSTQRSPTDIHALRIIHYPDPRLKRRCAPIATFDARLAQLAAKMLDLMYEASGVGLAAPQVGILRRLFVCNTTGKPEGALAFVNPTLELTGHNVEAEEGCLSIPEVYADLVRCSKVTLRGQDLQGNPVEAQAAALLARVWQHELDHLNGVLIIDRMSDSARLANRRALRHLENKHRAKR